MKIILYTKDLRIRASSGHGGQGVFFGFSVTDPPHKEAPSAAAIIVPDGKSGNNPRTISEYYVFHRKTPFHSF
jgi:hypothetical protein